MMFSRLPKFNVPLFENGAVYLCRTRDEWEGIHRHLGSKAQKLERKGAANTFRSLDSGENIYLLAVFDNAISTLAHEGLHIVFDICSEAGVEIVNGGANETHCYLLDKIIDFALPYLKSQS